MIGQILSEFLKERGLLKEFNYNASGYLAKSPYKSLLREQGLNVTIEAITRVYKEHSMPHCMDFDEPETRDRNFWLQLHREFVEFYRFIKADYIVD